MTQSCRLLSLLAILSAAICLGQATSHPLEQLQIFVKAVQGGAQYRPPGTTRWIKLAVGAQLMEGVEFRTGPKGAIQFTIGTDQIFRVDRLTVVKVLRASLMSDGTIKTDLGMQYGRISKDVDAPERPHDDTIVSPSSTLAVRGTHVSLYDQPPYTPEAVSLTGRAVFETVGRQVVAFGAKGQGTAVVNSDQPDPANNALNTRIIDPSDAYARSPDEEKLLADLITNGAVVNVSNPYGLPIVKNATLPPDSGPLVNPGLSISPGPPPLGLTITQSRVGTLTPPVADASLEFVVRWNTNTNVDLQMTAQSFGETIFPATGLNSTAKGGHILFDNQGGPNGGFEVITYPQPTFPVVSYDIAAIDQGPLATQVTFNAFIRANGVLGPQTLLALPASFTNEDEVTFSIVKGQTAGVLAPVGGGFFAVHPAAMMGPASPAAVVRAAGVAQTMPGEARMGRTFGK